MYSTLVQTESSFFSASFELRKDSAVIASAHLKNSIAVDGAIEIIMADTGTYTMRLRYSKELGNIAKNDEDKIHIPYEIYDADQRVVGDIAQKQIKRGIFNRFEYFEMNDKTGTYQLYAIGLGKEGNKFPVYKDDIQIALIEKDCIVYNNLDEYRIYAIDEGISFVTFVFGLYIDVLMYGNRGEKMKESVQKTYNLTTNKELRSKYDPTFIERCK